MKINVIIPTFNRGSVIPQTLDSLEAQTYKDWECIVVDDHSTDDTRRVVESFSHRDPRFIYMLNDRKKGAQGARNTGLYNCNSEWVFFFDSDNQLQPECLQELMVGACDNVDVVQCFSKVIDVETGPTGGGFRWRNYGNIEKRLYTGDTYVDFNHAIIRRSKMLEISGLDEDCPSMQEWDTHLRLSKTARYFTVEKELVNYYVGAQDAISSDNKKAIRGRLFILEKHMDEWRRHMVGFCRFVYIFNSLIMKCQDAQFKELSLKKLDALVSNRKQFVFLGYFVNKWFALKKHVSKYNETYEYQ